MFTAEQRGRLRQNLLETAQADERITAGAITGSAAARNEDAWSDVDLAFAVRDGEELHNVIGDWTARMYSEHFAVHHTDVLFGSWVYRVFLLLDTLQVDLAFTPSEHFQALAPTFHLVFGDVAKSPAMQAPAVEDFVGQGWLHALHARSAIVRGKLWQAEYMVSGVRDNALALACHRHGLLTSHGRGIDMLPVEVAASFEPSLVRAPNIEEVARAFRAVINVFLDEIRLSDTSLAARLDSVLLALADSVKPDL